MHHDPSTSSKVNDFHVNWKWSIAT